ncbi:MAG: hypothetical protein HKM93_09065 [Desulfobacteraceae bacterium]|nr:hypothetical protein [Desulfobacteraceae bacterium]
MNPFNSPHLCSRNWFVGLLVLITAVILYFGLNPKDFHFINNVNRISDTPGIRFGDYSIAYTEPFLNNSPQSLSDSYSIEISLKPSLSQEPGQKFILLFYNGDADSQLLLTQYRTWLIMMNGDDYAHKRKTKRISMNMESFGHEPIYLTITTGANGTKLYANGALAAEKKDLRLQVPSDGNSRLILGNSAHGGHYWQGVIYSLGLYAYELDAGTILRHYRLWKPSREYAFAEKSSPHAFYLLDRIEQAKSHDASGNGNHLIIPSQLIFLENEMLSWRMDGVRFAKGFILDTALNLTGFVPFGMVLSVLLIGFNRSGRGKAIVISVLAGFSLSLFIEILQAWMPSRTSSAPDLILNTLGAFIGAYLISCFIPRHRASV